MRVDDIGDVDAAVGPLRDIVAGGVLARQGGTTFGCSALQVERLEPAALGIAGAGYAPCRDVVRAHPERAGTFVREHAEYGAGSAGTGRDPRLRGRRAGRGPHDAALGHAADIQGTVTGGGQVLRKGPLARDRDLGRSRPAELTEATIPTAMAKDEERPASRLAVASLIMHPPILILGWARRPLGALSHRPTPTGRAVGGASGGQRRRGAGTGETLAKPGQPRAGLGRAGTLPTFRGATGTNGGAAFDHRQPLCQPKIVGSRRLAHMEVQPARLLAGSTARERDHAEEGVAGAEGPDDPGEHGSHHVPAGPGLSLSP